MESNQTVEQIESINQIPAVCLEFEPTMAQQFLTIKDGQYQRLIFTEVDLREKEETHLEQFREYCTQNKITLP